MLRRGALACDDAGPTPSQRSEGRRALLFHGHNLGQLLLALKVRTEGKPRPPHAAVAGAASSHTANANIFMKPLIVALATILVAQAPRAPGQTLTVVASFTGSAGRGPSSQLTQGVNGRLYGTTAFGGSHDEGTVFEVTSGGELRTLATFNGANGSYPGGGLVQAPDGTLYGITQDGGEYDGGTVFRLAPEGTLQALVSFDGTDGSYPLGRLLAGTNGDLYGTTSWTGLDGTTNRGLGTVFRVSPGGALTTLARFTDTNGNAPWGGLVMDGAGNLYGTTEQGGDLSLYGGSGYGTVLRLGPDGALKTLVAFQWTNGASPESALVRGKDGNFYGTTVAGGKFGHGTVFKMTPEGALTTLGNFDQTNGAVPYAGLIQASDGNFYGTTAFGGDFSLFNGRGIGTVFRVTADGVLTTLARFEQTNGSAPSRALLQAGDGDLYGAAAGGPPGAEGVIFKITGLNLIPKFQSIQISGGLVHLVWGAIPGRSYRVQYRTGLGSTTWTDLPGDVLANSSSAVKTDTVTAGQRFYRVLLLP